MNSYLKENKVKPKCQKHFKNGGIKLHIWVSSEMGFFFSFSRNFLSVHHVELFFSL